MAAIGAVDMALWDIKGKMAGMPVYELLGGKVRFAIDTYAHASGSNTEEVLDSVAAYQEKGFRNIRMQLGGYGSTHLSDNPDWQKGNFGNPDDNTIDPQAYKRGPGQVWR